MLAHVTVISATAALFVAIIIHLAAKPSYASKLTGVVCFLAGAGGLIYYGYGFSCVIDSIPLAIVRALLAVCGMFVGNDEFSAVMDAPGMDTAWAQAIFWVLQIFALYTTASAAVSTLGAGALRKLRLWLSRRSQLHVIFGVRPDTVAFARKLLTGSDVCVVFVDSQADPSCAESINNIGCVLRCDGPALNPDRRFLRSIGIRPGKRSIAVYALQKNYSANISYCCALRDAMKASGIHPAQTRAVMLGNEDVLGAALQNLGDQYGYGEVQIYAESDLAARLLTSKYPPCSTMTFDETGKAVCDFDALIIGFGQVGQSVLRSLVMNGQFEGSRFHAAVFSPDCSQTQGYLSHTCGSMFREYDITFHDSDGRSPALFDYVTQRKNTLKYIAVCTGSDKISERITEDLMRYLTRLGCRIPVYRCSRSGVIHTAAIGADRCIHSLYTPEILCKGALDAMAAAINHHYCKGISARDDWAKCDYFSRMSSRASADFIPALLKCAGTDETGALQSWNPTGALLENLGKTEHLRWCAFHYAMGYSTMSHQQWEARAEEYRKGNSIRISKDTDQRRHACLIPWEELDALSQAENAVTGKSVDYKAMDFQNVLSLPAVIRAGQQAAPIHNQED